MSKIGDSVEIIAEGGNLWIVPKVGRWIIRVGRSRAARGWRRHIRRVKARERERDAQKAIGLSRAISAQARGILEPAGR